MVAEESYHRRRHATGALPGDALVVAAAKEAHEGASS
jgi:hypothetical protein